MCTAGIAGAVDVHLELLASGGSTVDKERQLSEAGSGDARVMQVKAGPGAVCHRDAVRPGVNRRGGPKIVLRPGPVAPARRQPIVVDQLRRGPRPRRRERGEQQRERDQDQTTTSVRTAHSMPHRILAAGLEEVLLSLYPRGADP